MISRPSRLIVSVLCCGLVVSGCAADGTSPGSTQSDSPTSTASSSPYETQRREGTQDVLDRWADAIRSNDVDALKATLDPAASEQFVQSEIRRAAAVSALPLTDWSYELLDEPETPVPSEVAGPLDAADVWAPSVVLRYAVSGPDAEPTSRQVSLLVAERDDEWKVVSDADISGIERTTWRGPWDFGPVITRSVPTSGGVSVVVGHPDRSVLVDDLAAELPAAVDAVSDFYGDRWSRTALVFMSDSVEEFAASAGDATAAADVAAVTVSDAVVPGAPVTGQRIVFSPAAQERLSEFTTRSVLRHELTHVAARADTVDGSPMWMLEGFADYSGYRGSGVPFARIAPTLSRVVAVGGPPIVLPEDSDFAAGGSRSTLAYESAWSVCAFVAERFGEPVLSNMYERLATGPKSAAETADAIGAATGSSAEDFLQAWGSWVVEQSS